MWDTIYGSFPDSYGRTNTAIKYLPDDRVAELSKIADVKIKCGQNDVVFLKWGKRNIFGHGENAYIQILLLLQQYFGKFFFFFSKGRKNLELYGKG